MGAYTGGENYVHLEGNVTFKMMCLLLNVSKIKSVIVLPENEFV